MMGKLVWHIRARAQKRRVTGLPISPISVDELGVERGSVTAELAVALPAVVLLLITIIAIAAAFGTQIRVSDAARTGARLYSLGQPREQVVAAISTMAGAGATVEITADGQWATVEVQRHLRIGPANLGPFRLAGTAVVWVEP